MGLSVGMLYNSFIIIIFRFKMASDPARDEVMKKFSRNLKKLLDNRDNKPSKSHSHQSQRGVRFNPRTVDVSFGGTETSGKIKDLALDTANIDIDICVSTEKTDKLKENFQPKSRGTSDGRIDKGFKVPTSKPSKGSNGPEPGSSRSPRRNSDSEAKREHSSKSNGTQNVITPVLNSINNQVHTPIRRHTMDQLKQSSLGIGTPDCFKPVAFETPMSTLKMKMKRNRSDDDSNITEDSSVTVAVRVRPFSSR